MTVSLPTQSGGSASPPDTPVGFQFTDVGAVPADWNVEMLSRIADVRTGPFGSALHESDYVDVGTPIITVEHLSDTGITHQSLPLVSDHDKARLAAYELREGDIVFSRVGSVDRNSLVGPQEDGWLFSGRLLRVRISTDDVHPRYLSYYFHSEPFKKRIRSVAVGQTMASLNTQILRSIQVVLPELSEQRAIAGALSDVDALIVNLEGLIRKKKAVKQGVMQQLLTGKIRLPGFDGDWDERPIGDIFTIRVGSSKSRHVESIGKYLIVDMGSVSQDGRLIASKPTNFVGDFLAKGELVMPKDDIGGGKIIGKVAYIDSDHRYVLGDHVYALQARDGDPLFFSYAINGYRTNTSLRSKVVGSAQLGLPRKAVLDEMLSVPSSAEQTAIATVLSDVDAEIARLEARLNKTRDVKTGLMQELLTGRTRIAPSKKKTP